MLRRWKHLLWSMHHDNDHNYRKVKIIDGQNHVQPLFVLFFFLIVCVHWCFFLVFCVDESINWRSLLVGPAHSCLYAYLSVWRCIDFASQFCYFCCFFFLLSLTMTPFFHIAICYSLFIYFVLRNNIFRFCLCKYGNGKHDRLPKMCVVYAFCVIVLCVAHAIGPDKWQQWYCTICVWLGL